HDRAERDGPPAGDDATERVGPAPLVLGRLAHHLAGHRRGRVRGQVDGLVGRARVPVRLLRLVLRGPAPTLDAGHAASVPSAGMPAIMRPSTSRGVVDGTMPTTRPRYITRIRSPS